MGTKFERIGVVAPCEAITDYPTYYRGDDARSVLAAWTVAWRPGLIAHSESLPEITSTYSLPEASDGALTLLLVTIPAEGGELTDWLAEVSALQGPRPAIIEGVIERGEAIAQIDAALPDIPQATPELDREFFALGYAYQQCSQLTPDMHYGGIFQAELFRESVIAAARSAVAGNREAMLHSLATSYDQLEECRNHIYGVEPTLIDVLLVAETTLGQPLIDELNTDQPINVLLSGKLLDLIARQQPEVLAALRDAGSGENVCFITGGFPGDDVSTLSPEAMFRELQRSLDTFQQHLGVSPQIFGQHATAAPPRLPQLLSEIGMKGALMVGFNGGDPLPLDMGRATWVGIDGTTLETINGVPRDLAQPDTILRVAEVLQESLQRDYAASLILAGWPGARTFHYEDFRLVAQRSGLLGRFAKLDELFETEPASGHWSQVNMDSLGPAKPLAQIPSYAFNLGEQHELTAGLCKLSGALNENRRPSYAETATAFVHVADALGVEVDGNSNTRLAMNPWSFSKLAHHSQNEEVPPHAVAICKEVIKPEDVPRVDGNVLRNEHIELTINQDTGGIQAVRPHRVRRNFLSQRLVLLDSRNRPTACTMQLDGFEQQDFGPNVAAVASKGFVLDQAGKLQARFEQSFRLDCGAHFATCEISIWPEDLPYLDLACEFRCSEPDAPIYRGLQWSRLPLESARVTAFEYLQIASPQTPLTIAAARTQWMIRTGEGRFATILTPEPNCRKWCYEYAIGFGNRYPMQTLLGGLSETDSTPVIAKSDTPSSAWWLHLGAANVLATHLNVTQDSPRTLKLRLIETEGRVGKVTIRLAKPIQSARRTGFSGQPGETLEVVDGTVPLEIGPYGWLACEVSW